MLLIVALKSKHSMVGVPVCTMIRYRQGTKRQGTPLNEQTVEKVVHIEGVDKNVMTASQI